MRALSRSRVHMLTVAAARLEHEGANPKLIEDLRAAAQQAAERLSEGRYLDDQQQRIEHQRTLFGAIYPNDAADKLKAAMLQRCYDLMWDGDGLACDAIAEFLPSADVEAMFDAWEHDQMGRQPSSKFYEAAA